MEAIAQVESNGHYKATGVKTKDGYAYGKYQIMGYNVKLWSKQTLGYRISFDEFLNTPRYQDAIAASQIVPLLESYTPAEVASIWFSGSHLTAGHITDANGKRVDGYVSDVMKDFYNQTARAK